VMIDPPLLQALDDRRTGIQFHPDPTPIAALADRISGAAAKTSSPGLVVISIARSSIFCRQGAGGALPTLEPPVSDRRDIGPYVL
jgi:hypothetical protein